MKILIRRWLIRFLIDVALPPTNEIDDVAINTKPIETLLNQLPLESTKATSMEVVWKMLVQEYLKNKEYLRRKDKAKK